jgi:hypothetical protein
MPSGQTRSYARGKAARPFRRFAARQNGADRNQLTGRLLPGSIPTAAASAANASGSRGIALRSVAANRRLNCGCEQFLPRRRRTAPFGVQRFTLTRGTSTRKRLRQLLRRFDRVPQGPPLPLPVGLESRVAINPAAELVLRAKQGTDYLAVTASQAVAPPKLPSCDSACATSRSDATPAEKRSCVSLR